MQRCLCVYGLKCKIYTMHAGIPLDFGTTINVTQPNAPVSPKPQLANTCSSSTQCGVRNVE